MKIKYSEALDKIKAVLNEFTKVEMAEEQPEEKKEAKAEEQAPVVETKYVTSEELSKYATKEELNSLVAELTSAVESLRDIAVDDKAEVPVEASEETAKEDSEEAEEAVEEIELAEEEGEREVVHSPETEVEKSHKSVAPNPRMSTRDYVNAMLFKN